MVVKVSQYNGFCFCDHKTHACTRSGQHLLRRLHEQINLSNRLFEQGSRTNSLPGFLAWTKIWETLVTKVLPTWQGRDVTSVGNLPSYYSTYPDRNRKRMKSLWHPETLTPYSTSVGKWLSLILMCRFPHHTPVVWKEFSPQHLLADHYTRLRVSITFLNINFIPFVHYPLWRFKTYSHFVVNIRLISSFLHTLQAVSAKLSFKLNINVFTWTLSIQSAKDFSISPNSDK